MVFNIIQNGNRSCYKCGNRLGFMEGSYLDRICDACKRREDEERKAHQQLTPSRDMTATERSAMERATIDLDSEIDRELKERDATP